MYVKPPAPTHCPTCSNELAITQSIYSNATIRWCTSYCFLHFEDETICCNRPDISFIRYHISNGTFQLRKICNKCKTLGTYNFKQSIVASHQFQNLPVIKQRDTAYKEKKYAEKTFWRKKINDGKRAAFFKKYNAYLKSPAWQEKRSKVLLRDNYQCQGCGAKATEVHHTTYDRVGNEHLTDLVSVCHSCHETIHNRKW